MYYPRGYVLIFSLLYTKPLPLTPNHHHGSWSITAQAVQSHPGSPFPFNFAHEELGTVTVNMSHFEAATKSPLPPHAAPPGHVFCHLFLFTLLTLAGEVMQSIVLLDTYPSIYVRFEYSFEFGLIHAIHRFLCGGGVILHDAISIW